MMVQRRLNFTSCNGTLVVCLEVREVTQTERALPVVVKIITERLEWMTRRHPQKSCWQRDGCCRGDTAGGPGSGGRGPQRCRLQFPWKVADDCDSWRAS